MLKVRNEIETLQGLPRIHKRQRSKKETDKLGEQEVELEKALTPRFIHSQVPKDKLSL